MRIFRSVVLISNLLLTTLLLQAQTEKRAESKEAAQTQKKGEIRETVGPMTEPVIQARLKALGYSNISIKRTNTLRYDINATKNGKPAKLQFHPQTGEVHELTAAGKPAKVWRMPVEPPPTPPHVEAQPH